MNALNDCLSDLRIAEAGMIVVFRHFEIVEKLMAQALVEAFANNSRRHILFGRKLLLLVQVNSRDFKLMDVGSCPVFWNRLEYLK